MIQLKVDKNVLIFIIVFVKNIIKGILSKKEKVAAQTGY